MKPSSLSSAALAILLAAVSASRAQAETKPTETKPAEAALSVQTITASPGGFMVDATLITGAKEAILIDSSFTLADAHRVVGAILDSGKTLTTVYVTHGHPDHYFGLPVIHEAFPKAKLVALPATIKEIKATMTAKLKQWGPMYGANLPAKPIVPAPLAGTSLTIEGQTLEIHGGVQGDEPANSYVWIPSIKTVVAGDTVYYGVHPWTAETNVESRKAWLKTLDDLTALAPVAVVAGHKDAKLKDDPAGIEKTRAYLKAFDELLASSKTAAELEGKLKAKFPDLALDIIAHFGAAAQFPAAAAAK